MCYNVGMNHIKLSNQSNLPQVSSKRGNTNLVTEIAVTLLAFQGPLSILFSLVNHRTKKILTKTMLQSWRFRFCTISGICKTCYCIGEMGPVMRGEKSGHFSSRSSEPVHKHSRVQKLRVRTTNDNLFINKSKHRT